MLNFRGFCRRSKEHKIFLDIDARYAYIIFKSNKVHLTWSQVEKSDIDVTSLSTGIIIANVHFTVMGLEWFQGGGSVLDLFSFVDGLPFFKGTSPAVDSINRVTFIIHRIPGECDGWHISDSYSKIDFFGAVYKSVYKGIKKGSYLTYLWVEQRMLLKQWRQCRIISFLECLSCSVAPSEVLCHLQLILYIIIIYIQTTHLILIRCNSLIFWFNTSVIFVDFNRQMWCKSYFTFKVRNMLLLSEIFFFLIIFWE